jgi:DNA-binding NarL/FixJ family response regulator
MHKIIIGDSQVIYRTGMTRLLSTWDGGRIVAQCHDCSFLYQAGEMFRDAIIVAASVLKPDFSRLMVGIGGTPRRVIVIAENVEPYLQYITSGASGVIFRGTTSAVLVDCVRRVAAGEAAVPPVGVLLEPDQQDPVGIKVRARLTTRELKILSMIVQGLKNKEIAIRLSTSEQMVKNYLRMVFDKTGASGRLELALFTAHHRVLASAVADEGSRPDLRPLR